MKVKVTNNFFDKVEGESQGKEVLRAKGDEFTISKERFDEIAAHGDYVKEVKAKSEPKK